MSSRRSRSNGNSSGVRGPNSALTEFLKEKGISFAGVQEQNRRNAAAQAALTSGAANEDGNDDNNGQQQGTGSNVQVVIPTSTRRRSARTQPIIELDENSYEEEEEEDLTPKRKGKGKAKMTKAEIAKAKKAEKNKLKRKRGADDDDDFDLTPQVPNPGQISFCESCNCRFTVTPYSKPGPDGEGLLCTACGKKNAAADKAEKKSRQVGKRQKKAQARKLLDNEDTGVPNLRDLCIKLVANHINDVEALGDIGSINMDSICRIISRNRSLNNDTMKLFLDPGSQKLSFYDASQIKADQLKMLAAVVPTLRRLELNFCGYITDECLDYFSSQLKDLEAIQLLGPFLITQEAYVRFFKARGANLYEVSIGHTARFGYDAFEALVDNCPNLEILRLKTLTYIEDNRVQLLTGLKNLKILEISDPDGTITDKPIIDILYSCGSDLLELNLDYCTELTDDVLKAIRQACPRLQSLYLADMDLLTDEGFAELFGSWDINSGLSRLGLQRCINLNTTGLVAVLEHSAATLEYLDLNSCGDLDDVSWAFVETQKFPRLTELDVSFVRSVNDQVVENFVSLAPELNLLKVWGDPFVTNFVKVPEHIRLVGREADIVA